MKTWKQGEKEVAEHLGNWWATRFFRSPASGAMATMLGEESIAPSIRKKFTGDIYCEDDAFPFCVEVKCYDEVPLYPLLTSDEGVLWKFWEQAKRQGVRYGQIPLLVFKEDRRSFFVGFPVYFYELACESILDAGRPVYTPQIYYPESTNSFWRMAIRRADLVVMELSKFTNALNKELVVELAKAAKKLNLVESKPD
jgi:hypothetical protein